MRIFIYFVFFTIILSCATRNEVKSKPSVTLNFLGEIEIPFDEEFNGTKIGGLSGIDYNPKDDLFYMVSDDRSVHNAARFYQTKLELYDEEESFQPMFLEFKKVTFLKNMLGNDFPSWNDSKAQSIDPEEIQFNEKTQTFFITEEGERIEDSGELRNPQILEFNHEGKQIGSYKTPQILAVKKEKLGPRKNAALEGFCFNADYSKAYASIEKPLFQDGEASTIENSSRGRVFEFDTQKREETAQYVYEISSVAFPPNPINASSINGVSAILWESENKLWVVERSYSTGRKPCTIKLFLVDVSNATNVKELDSLLNAKKQIVYAKKELILNFDTLNRYIDNVEGISYGPTLSNGNRTLAFITDNNFSKKQKTQLLLFEIL